MAEVDRQPPASNPPSNDFRSILARAARGDESAFERLFEHASEPLLFYCDIRLGTKLRGEGEPIDVVQDTYVQAWGSIDRLDCADWKGFMRWLYGVAENRIRAWNERASAAKRTPPGPRAPLSLAVERLRASITTAESRLARDERQQRTRAALLELDDDAREAVVLHYFHGYSIAAVAQELGRPETTTRRLLARSLDRLGLELGRTSGDS